MVYVENEFVEHIPCTECGSSDANSLYTDGHTYCFSCKTYGQPDEQERIVDNAVKDVNFKTGEYKPLVRRCLTEKTTRFWDYQSGDGVQVANYKDKNGKTVAQKLR